MKTLFILIASFAITAPLLAQTSKIVGVPLPQKKVTVTELNAYLDSLAKINNDEASNAPSTRKRPFSIIKDKNGYTIVDGFYSDLPIMNNQIPVLKPDSDYVYQMPGTFPFDQNKLKNQIAQFVNPSVKVIDRSPLKQYFEHKDKVQQQKPPFKGQPLPKK